MILYLELNGEFTPIEIGIDNDLAITYNYDGLNSPVDYISEFSYEIKIPKTKENNIKFSQFDNIDRFITDTSFNPSEKIRYILLSNDGEIVSRGSAYLNNIDKDFYYVQLLGSLNYVFQRLLNSGWDSSKAEEDTEYYKLPEYLQYNMFGYGGQAPVLNASTVYATWRVDDSAKYFDFESLKANFNNLSREGGFTGLTNSQIYVANILQFAPSNQGKYKDFKSNKMYYPTSGSKYVSGEIKHAGNGLVEAQVGEYRSYYQKPCIYVGRLLQWYREECKNITGYDLVYDDNWYNDTDYFVNKLVYTLPSLFTNGEPKVLSEATTQYNLVNTIIPSYINYEPADNTVKGIEGLHVDSTTNIGVLHNVYKYEINSEIHLDMSTESVASAYGIYYNYDNPLLYSVAILDDENYLLNVKSIGVVPLCDEVDANGDYKETLDNTINSETLDLLKNFSDEIQVIRYHKYDRGINWTLGVVTSELYCDNYNNKSLHILTSVGFFTKKAPFSNRSGQALNGAFTFNYLERGRAYLGFKSKIKRIEIESNRSGQKITLEKLFKNINPFSIILKFTKLMNMVWIVNDTDKKIYLYDRETFFLKCLKGGVAGSESSTFGVPTKGVLNLTNKVDYSKGYTLNVPSWVDKFIELNYSEDVDETYFKTYFDKYNRTYGSKKLITTNNKNNTTFKLFCNSDTDTINPSIVSSEYLIPYSSVIAGYSNNYVQNFPEISSVNNGDSADIWNNFYFRNSNGGFNEKLGEGWRPGYVIITDDYPIELSGEYAWHSGTGFKAIKSKIRPRFNTATFNDEVSIQFAPTQEIYHQFPYLPTTKYLYENKWQSYMEQIYNKQSKKVSLSIHLNAATYRRLKLNPLVQIKNTLFLVVSIEDWNEEATTSKVNLVSIQDLNKLTGGKIIINEDTLLWDDNNVVAFDDNSGILLNE